MNQAELSFVDQLVAARGTARRELLPLLLAVQNHYRYLPEAALARLATLTAIPEGEIRGVASFYSHFRFAPIGRHVIKVCDGTACHVRGSTQVFDAIRHRLEIPDGEDTDSAKLFTVQKVFCLGCCTLAPAVQIDDVTYGHLGPERVPGMLDDFTALAARRDVGTARAGRGAAGEIRLCMDSCCLARGCGKTRLALETALAETGVDARIKRVACVVMCERAPMLELAPAGADPIVYSQVPDDELAPLLRRHFPRAPWHKRLTGAVRDALDHLLTWEVREPLERYESPVTAQAVADFFGPQRHIATEHYGRLDPLDLDEYRRLGGFAGLTKARELSPEAILDVIRESGLRGRGGAGFLSARKWEMVRQQPGERKVIVCNGDEGDPGAFMDRMLMESFPYRVIEGMAIAARAVGAQSGFIYVRAEYPYAVERLREALRRVEAAGLLADGGTTLALTVFEGAGAFVCGEETAMIASLEGRRGLPRLRPPYPAESGYEGLPTLISNVETLAMVPWILGQGGAAFANLGTHGSRGTKVFALAGKVVRGGLIEVPMGVTIRQVVDEIGGGVPAGNTLKGVLIGGPSGGCVPASLADTCIDYDSLVGIGAIMGSGGLVVLDDEDCMVSIARYFMAFCQQESCGKCTFCRIGTRKMLNILDRLCAGQGRQGDLELLAELAGEVREGSLCGLGRTAPNPVMTTLTHFRDEYEAHLQGRCPAGQCKALIRYTITDRCVGCTLCAQHCPDNAIPMTPYRLHVIDDTACTRCGICRQVCPEDAVAVQ